MLVLSQRAATKVKEIAAAEQIESPMLRVRVIGGGCAGFSYDLYFDDGQPGDLDEVFDDQGVRLIVDALSHQYVDGTEIDYVESTAGEGFKFKNPKSKGSCGCGSSFSA